MNLQAIKLFSCHKQSLQKHEQYQYVILNWKYVEMNAKRRMVKMNLLPWFFNRSKNWYGNKATLSVTWV
jgi:hypothetical protein